MELEEINNNAKENENLLNNVRSEIQKVIVGQEEMIDKLLIGLFTGGHILLEGVPGLAKSLTVNTISKVIGADFKRIQFTPDLLPADIIGTKIYYIKTGEFVTKKGPLFSNIILADEINRAPAKVQSALLEAMQEKQITIGEESFELEEPFLVLATQNPLEQEGTYPLPEAQQDRFMLKLKIEYPKLEEERMILEMTTSEKKIENIEVNEILTKENVFKLRKLVRNVYIDNKLKAYILNIVFKTREQSDYIFCGASPRASINLVLAAKAKAFLSGRGYVVPDDIKAVIYDVLRHRIILTYEAEAEEITVEKIISDILEEIKLP